MIELLLTCYLASAVTFTVPVGWTVERVVASGSPPIGSSMTLQFCPGPKPCGHVEQTYVVLRRSIKPGERATIPDGCKAEATAK